MKKVFLIQSVDTATFRKLAKDGVKTNEFDCCTKVATYLACRSKKKAVDSCRKYNRVRTQTVFFVVEIRLD